MRIGEPNIIEDANMTKSEAKETERSKKRRIKKPWSKLKIVTIVFPRTDCLVTPFGIICHPRVARQLREGKVLGWERYEN